MTFREVIGQEEAKIRLKTLVEEDRVPHAMLFCGPRGCGKMALAMAFASYLLCRNHQDGDSCGRCPQCAMLRKWSHPDLHFTYPVIKPANSSSDFKPVSDDYSKEWHEMLAGGAYFTIDQWLNMMNAANQQAIITVKESDEIARKLSLKSSQGGYKISLIWLPERVRDECANKLLKLIEEPPSQTVFLLVSEEPTLLLETIRSRTQRFDIRGIQSEDIERALTEKRGIEPETAHRIARVANGSWTQALQTLDADNENREFLDMFIKINTMALTRNINGMKEWAITCQEQGREKQKRMLKYFHRMIRESFFYNFHQPDLTYTTQDEENFIKKLAPFINEDNIIELSEMMDVTIRDIGQNANAKIVFFDLALQLTKLLRKRA